MNWILPSLILLMWANLSYGNERACDGAGVFPDPSDSSSFIICSEIGDSTYVSKIVNCPDNYTFSEEDRTCIQEERDEKSLLRVRRATSVICKGLGPSCASCDLLVVCANMSGKLVPITNLSCSETNADNICDSKISGCRSPLDDSICKPSSVSSSFQCIQPGFFPDPYDCKKYHICDDDLVHYEDNCDMQYDPTLAICTGDAPCTNPTDIVKCDKDPKPKAISSNFGFYSVCIPALSRTFTGEVKVVYQIAVMQCPTNQQFNDVTSSCELVCKKRPDHFTDPEDCHSYYECPSLNDQNKKNTPIKRTCPANLAYDSKKNMCILENKVTSCKSHSISSRDAQITTPNTINVSPSKSATQSLSTTAATQLTPKITERCIEQSVFQDTSNCRRYYQCLGGRLIRRQCPILSYFEPGYQSCIIGIFCGSLF